MVSHNRIWRRWSLVLLFGVAAAGFGYRCNLAVAEEFPYTAVVVKHQTELRSGPGTSYYATDKLAAGMTVEVYRHDPGGWCAVRPPEGSFAWVRSRNLEIAEDGLAVVSNDNVVARTGSALSTAKDVIQVHLERGEIVELIDGDEPNPGSWRKIAPPAGEFRWIALEDIEKEKSPIAKAAVTTSDNSAAKPAVQPAQFTDASTPAPATDDSILPVTEEESLTEQQRPRKLLSRAALHREIVEIDLELSSRVSNDESTWQFDDLVARVERAIELSPTALDRATARDLLTKIERFERLADGGRGAAGDSLAARLRAAGAPGASGAVAALDPLNPNAPVDTSRYDGVGRLAQVISKQPGAPQYALVDSAGQVRYYLNPAPGINLRPFLNKQVGVNGTRGAIAARQRQVISAQRVTELPNQATRRF